MGEWYLSVLRTILLWGKLIDVPESFYMTVQFDKLALIFVALPNLTGGKKSTYVTKHEFK